MKTTGIQLEPQIIAETPSYLVLYKPPRMHTAPLRSGVNLNPGENNTLLAWAALHFPEVDKIKGRKDIEGGLIHRLDYETQGLVLCARTEKTLNVLLKQQEAGSIIKEYEAVSGTEEIKLPGFPPFPNIKQNEQSTVIESAFRPYGKGQKAVRPLIEGNSNFSSNFSSYFKSGKVYQTEIFSRTETEGCCFFRLRIRKGFRHQIRCHLAWISHPILNDPLYGIYEESPAAGFMALRAYSIAFTDPDTGKPLRISAAK